MCPTYQRIAVERPHYSAGRSNRVLCGRLCDLPQFTAQTDYRIQASVYDVPRHSLLFHKFELMNLNRQLSEAHLVNPKC